MKNKTITKIASFMAAVLCLTGYSQPLHADDDYDPSNPAEPNKPVFIQYHKLTVAVNPSSAGYASGAGTYAEQTKHTVNTSANTDFVFDHWELNGAYYGTTKSFSYTIGEDDAHFVAVYIYTPSNPNQPSDVYVEKNRLYFVPEPAEACSFNRTSGQLVSVGTKVTLTPYPNQDYDFIGWYDGDTFLSSNLSYAYTMQGTENVTLTARFNYNPPPYDPENPDQPLSEGGDIDNSDTTHGLLGDANDDGKVNIIDVNLLIGKILGTVTSGCIDENMDMDKDGKFNVADLNLMIGIILSDDDQSL